MVGERQGGIVFFGTPDFAVPTLAALCRAGRRPALVVTQPDRPVGRGRRPQEPPVGRWARREGLEVEQPARVRDPGFLELLAARAPDVALVVAFGQIFPRRLLELPPRGCINLHASLLPRHRGAAPIQAAIMAGERVTGVTTMLMEEELDSGPILLQEEVAIGPEETAGELAERLAARGAELVIETLERLDRGDLVPRSQDHREATFAPRLSRADGRVDWDLRATELFDRLRGLTPWPGLACELRDRPLKIAWARPAARPDGGAGAAPGTYLGAPDGHPLVACGGGTALALERLQRPGRRVVSAADFLRGEPLEAGERFR